MIRGYWILCLDHRTDFLRWVDTDVLIVDPLTKRMDPEKLVRAMMEGTWNLAQPIEILMKKRAKQLQRRKTVPDVNGEIITDIDEEVVDGE